MFSRNPSSSPAFTQATRWPWIAETGSFVVAHALGGEAGREALQFCHYLERFQNFADRHLGDESALMRTDLREAA